jgi:hydroxymethylpyrimidine/phosphomethylpyrimidine kinase
MFGRPWFFVIALSMPNSVAATKIEAVKTVLTIAGFDPSSGAGVTADLMVFAAHGLFGTSCITGLTVQSTLGVRATYAVDSSTIAETLACLHDDLPPAGIKIGMLGSGKAVAAVCDYLERLRANGNNIPIVVDPVIRSSSGRELLDTDGVELLLSRLVPLVDWVTPNFEELGWLTNLKTNNCEEVDAAASTLQRRIARQNGRTIQVLATGGDLNPPSDLMLSALGEKQWLSGERIETTSTHGTGCALSSALLCHLVSGEDSVLAAKGAKAYVTEALRSSVPIGHGSGPMNHLYRLDPWRVQD